ncbi:MAG: hypothetical protein ACRDQU_20765 [Pseudonocardiaceae bacterium]
MTSTETTATEYETTAITEYETTVSGIPDTFDLIDADTSTVQELAALAPLLTQWWEAIASSCTARSVSSCGLGRTTCSPWLARCTSPCPGPTTATDRS